MGIIEKEKKRKPRAGFGLRSSGFEIDAKCVKSTREA